MEPFRVHQGLVVPLDKPDVDTDQIIPKQFLKRVERTGFGEFLFYDWRFTPAGEARPEFPLNQPQYAGATILVTGRNFGCGSSREHAVWALLDFGIRAVVAPSFADIFRNNCVKNGIALVTLASGEVGQLLERARTIAGYRLTVDLEQCVVLDALGLATNFQVDEFARTRLLGGLDDIALTLRHEAEIGRYEQERERRSAAQDLG